MYVARCRVRVALAVAKLMFEQAAVSRGLKAARQLHKPAIMAAAPLGHIRGPNRRNETLSAVAPSEKLLYA